MSTRTRWVRSLNAQVATGAGIGFGIVLPTTGNVMYPDQAFQFNFFINAPGSSGLTAIVQALMPGDNPPANWITVGAMPAGVQSYLQLFGPFLDVRLNITANTGATAVNGDMMCMEGEWY